MALTEKYVSSLAGGSGDGNSAGSAYTWAQMGTEIMSSSGTGGQGKRYNIKKDGTYTRTTTENWGSATGTSTLPIVLRGYNTVIGDGYLGRTTDNGALITTNMPYVTYLTGNSDWTLPKYSSTETIRFEGSHSGRPFGLENRAWAIACHVTNVASSNDSGCVVVREGGGLVNCDFLQTGTGSVTGNMVNTDGQGIKIDSCRIIASSTSTSTGISMNDKWVVVYGCLIKGGGSGYGIRCTADDRAVFCRNNTITGWTDGIRWTTFGTYINMLFGNMVTDNSGYAFNDMNSGSMVLVGPNRTRDNTLGNYTGLSNWEDVGRIFPLVTTDTGGSETDYVNAAANDYNLIAASPARNQNIPLFSDLGAYDIKDAGAMAALRAFRRVSPLLVGLGGGAEAPAAYTAASAIFTGNSRIAFGSVSMSDGTQFSASFWLRASSVGGTAKHIMQGRTGAGGPQWRIEQGTTEQMFFGAPTTGTGVVSAATKPATFTADAWYHILISFDTTSTSKRHIYINGNSNVDGWYTYTASGNVALALGNFYVGNNDSMEVPYGGAMAEVWVDDTYRDFSIAANRLLFADETGAPKDLGSDGSIPFGVAPNVYLKFASGALAVNSGSGGGTGTVVGTLTSGTTLVNY